MYSILLYYVYCEKIFCSHCLRSGKLVGHRVETLGSPTTSLEAREGGGASTVQRMRIGFNGCRFQSGLRS